MTQPTPIHRFLGEVDLALGPFGLLGLPIAPCDASSVEAALKRQLGRIDRHPQGASPDAEEVRLALHVASAQLKDRAVQEEVLADLAWRPSVPIVRADPAPFRPNPAARAATAPGRTAFARGAAPAQGVPARPPSNSRGDRREFERMAVWVLTDAGGWNRAAQRRIAALAHAWSLSTPELMSSLSMLSSMPVTRTVGARSEAAPSAAQGTDAAAGVAEPARASGMAAARRWGLLTLMLIMVACSVFMILAAFDVNSSRRKAADGALDREFSLPGLEGLLPAPRGEPAQPEPQPVVREVALSRSAEAQPVSDRSPPPRPGLEPVADANTVEWAVFARAQLDRAAPAGASLAEVLRDATRFAIVNAAAARLQRSEYQATADARRQISALSENAALDEGDDGAPLSLARLTSPAQPPDGALALVLLANKRNAAVAIDTLKKLRVGRETLGPADCDAVAELALFSTGAELRGAARLVVMDEGRSPAMLEAVLDQLARSPPVAPASELIEELTRRPLPPPSDPSWPLKARAALLARLAEEIGAERDAELDDLAESLAGAYEAIGAALASANGAPAPATRGTDAARVSTRPQDAAEAVFGLWRDRAGVFRADPTIDRRVEEFLARRKQRLMLASGPIQRFVAEQGSVIEMMGLVVAAERPSQASRVEHVLDEFARERREAPHTVAQIRAGERAAARLWLAMMNQADLAARRRDGA